MKFLYVILFLAITQLANAQVKPEHYKIYSAAQKKQITLAELIAQADPAQVLFFGEEHNDSVGHFLEAEIFRLLTERHGRSVAASLEMFHTDVQPVINEYLAGIISEKNFIKEARAWNNYKDYRAVIEHAKAGKFDIIAANAAARYSNAVTMKGLPALSSLPGPSLKNLPPLPIDTATGPYYDKFIETLGGHGMGGMKIYQTQNLWDATMAWSINTYLKTHSKGKVFHLVGRFHADEKLGTYAKLAKMNAKLKMMNISAFSAKDFESPDWSKYSHLGDFVIVTDPDVKRSY